MFPWVALFFFPHAYLSSSFFFVKIIWTLLSTSKQSSTTFHTYPPSSIAFILQTYSTRYPSNPFYIYNLFSETIWKKPVLFNSGLSVVYDFKILLRLSRVTFFFHFHLQYSKTHFNLFLIHVSKNASLLNIYLHHSTFRTKHWRVWTLRYIKFNSFFTLIHS